MKKIIKNDSSPPSLIKCVIIAGQLFYFSLSVGQNNVHLVTTINGEKAKDGFSVVAGVGDVNGDGFDDMLVGAPGGNYAKLYFGGSPFDTLNYIKLFPDNAFTFGAAVAGGGDLNGDGYADFIIGAPQSSVFEPVWLGNAGKVFVYLGGAQVDTIPYMVLNGQGWYYDFGRSAAFAGDVNSDGYDDIIIGAPNDDIDGHGRAYIYFGGADMDGKEDILMEGEAGADAFGGSVSSAGDVNKDGFSDVLIGATQWGATEPIGKAYLVYGGNEIGLDKSTIFSDSSTVYFGWQVSRLNDINGDGYGDFGILALNYCGIISGKTLQSLINLYERPEWASFVSIAAGGDFNNDGFGDILISTEKIDTLITGGVLFYSGGHELTPKPDFELKGLLFPSSFGSSISYVGHIEGKDKVTILVGDDQGDATLGPGRVYIFSSDLKDKVEDKNNQDFPASFKLYPNYPNPFNSKTMISFLIDRLQKIQLGIYSTNGQLIETLISEWVEEGSHSLIWNAGQLASGVYLCRLVTANYSDTIKILLIK